MGIETEINSCYNQNDVTAQACGTEGGIPIRAESRQGLLERASKEEKMERLGIVLLGPSQRNLDGGSVFAVKSQNCKELIGLPRANFCGKELTCVERVSRRIGPFSTVSQEQMENEYKKIPGLRYLDLIDQRHDRKLQLD